MSERPARLRLSRAKGFNLKALSLAVNGLPAVNCARPGKWGNLWRVGLAMCGCRSAGECSHNQFRCDTAAEAVAEYRDWALGWKLSGGRRAALAELRGKNLACWCAPGAPCHADVLLELANLPICEPAP